MLNHPAQGNRESNCACMGIRRETGEKLAKAFFCQTARRIGWKSSLSNSLGEAVQDGVSSAVIRPPFRISGVGAKKFQRLFLLNGASYGLEKQFVQLTRRSSSRWCKRCGDTTSRFGYLRLDRLTHRQTDRHTEYAYYYIR